MGGWDGVPTLRLVTSYRSHRELGVCGMEQSVLWGPKRASSPKVKVSVTLELSVPRVGTRSSQELREATESDCRTNVSFCKRVHNRLRCPKSGIFTVPTLPGYGNELDTYRVSTTWSSRQYHLSACL